MDALIGRNLEELRGILALYGQPDFRAKQLHRWLYTGASFAEMKNLPGELRSALRRDYNTLGLVIEHRLVSKDGTEKYLYRLRDGHIIEGVLMRYHHGATLCLSTQVGCRMGCAFCASTLDGLARNLSAGEMIAQIVAVNRELPGEERVGNVVLMGSGEALDNYAETLRFLHILREDMGMSLRGVSLSTCGLAEKMHDFAEEGLPVTLSISLHAPDDDIRRQIMPVARKYTIGRIIGEARNYIDKTGRRVIFEYALIDGLNSDAAHARALAILLRGMQCHVNLIPLNSVAESSLKGASGAQVQAFLRELSANHISATVRREMGGDIQGACGQLRRAYIKREEGE